MKDLSIKHPMYFAATPDDFKKTKELRRYQTNAENILWARLCINQNPKVPHLGDLGGKIRQQQEIL